MNQTKQTLTEMLRKEIEINPEQLARQSDKTYYDTICQRREIINKVKNTFKSWLIQNKELTTEELIAFIDEP